ncbi:MAG: RNA-binding domain-containing protein [Nanoarchaeota archaeon]
MSIPIHYMTIRAFETEDETQKRVERAIERLLPETAEDNAIRLEQEHTVIEEGTDMSILKVTLKRKPHIKHTLAILQDMLGSEQCETIVKQENRVDEKGALYLRIDKNAFIDEHTAKLVDHGNCIHFRIMIEAHPKTRENALEAVREIFKQQRNG